MFINHRQFKNANPFQAVQAFEAQTPTSTSVSALSACAGNTESSTLRLSVRELIKLAGVRLHRIQRRIRVISKRRLRRARLAIHARKMRAQKRQAVRSTARPTQQLDLLALEPRIVFDAAIAATVDQIADQVAEQQAIEATSNNPQMATAPIDELSVPLEFGAGATQNVVFIDSDVKDFQGTIQDLPDSSEVIILDGAQDGFTQIRDHLAEYSNLNTAQIICGGDADTFSLSGTKYNNTDNPALSEQHETLQSALGFDGRLIIQAIDEKAETSHIATLVPQYNEGTGRSDVRESHNVDQDEMQFLPDEALRGEFPPAGETLPEQSETLANSGLPTNELPEIVDAMPGVPTNDLPIITEPLPGTPTNDRPLAIDTLPENPTNDLPPATVTSRLTNASNGTEATDASALSGVPTNELLEAIEPRPGVPTNDLPIMTEAPAGTPTNTLPRASASSLGQPTNDMPLAGSAQPGTPTNERPLALHTLPGMPTNDLPTLDTGLAPPPIAEICDLECIVFIDSSVTDASTIAASVPAGATTIYLDPGSDGLTQIAQHLAGATGIGAIHLVSHGEAGELFLGNTVVNEASIAGTHAASLATIAGALAPDADILIYGCNFGSDASAVAALSVATGADIAASSDDTGHAGQGGDWDLEVMTGAIETAALSAPAWNALLAPGDPQLDLDTSGNIAVPVAQGNAVAGQLGVNNPIGGFTSTVGHATGTFNVSTATGNGFDEGVNILADNNGVAVTFLDSDGNSDGPGGAADTFTVQFDAGADNNSQLDGIVLSHGEAGGDENTKDMTLTWTGDDATIFDPDGQLVIVGPGGATTPADGQTVSSGVIIRTLGPAVAAADTTWSIFVPTESLTVTAIAVDRPDGAGISNDLLNETLTFNVVLSDLGHEDTFIEGGEAISIATPDISLSDDGQIDRVDVSFDVIGLHGDRLVVDPADLPAGISIDPASTDTHIILTGTASAADYEAAIQAIKFETVGDHPDIETVRNIEIIVTDDGANTSKTVNTFITVLPDNDHDGVIDSIDIDDDNDGILDTMENAPITINLSPVPSESTSELIVLEDPSGNYRLEITKGDNPHLIAFDPATGRIGNSTSAITTQVASLVYSTANSPIPFELDIVQFNQINSMSTTSVRDAYAASVAGTWEPVGTPAAGVVAVDPSDTSSGDGDGLAVGAVVRDDADWTGANGTVPSAVQSFQGLVNADLGGDGDGVVSDVLVNFGGSTEGHVSRLLLDEKHTEFSLYIFDAGQTGMAWNYVPTTSITILPDSDGDGISDGHDIDSDNDGILDNIEGQSTTDYIAPSGPVGGGFIDTNGDGLDDRYDDSTAAGQAAGFVGKGITPADSDNDGEGDWRDYDSDNDGVLDRDENGLPLATSTDDTDFDGLLDDYEGSDVTDAFNVNEGIANPLNAFNDHGGYLPDADGDAAAGIPLSADLDYRDASFDNSPPTSPGNSVTHLEDTTYSFQAADFPIVDNDSDPLASVRIDTVPATGTLAFNGSAVTPGIVIAAGDIGQLTYTPLPDENGNTYASFTFSVNDGVAFAATPATMIVNVTPVNDLPTARNDDELTDEDTVLNEAVLPDNGSGADSDPENDPLNVTHVNGSVITSGGTITLPSGALLTMNSDGTYSYDPNGQFENLAVGDQTTDSFVYTIDDGNGGTDTATVTITIDGVNDAPLAQDDSETTDEDTVLNEAVLPDNGSGADSDPENDPLNVTHVNSSAITSGGMITLPSGALLTMNSDGTYSYDPNGQFENLAVGDQTTDSFVYTIDDGNGGTDTATVTITIDGVNDAPVNNIGLSDQTSHDGNATFSVPTAGNFTDPDGDMLTFSLGPNAPAWLTIDPASGVVSTIGPIPADASQLTNIGGGASGAYDITVVATDPSGDAAQDTFRLTIGNLAPVAIDDTTSLNEDDAPVSGNVITDPTTGDADTAPDTDVLIIAGAHQGGNALTVGQPFTVTGGGTLTLQSNGSYTFDPGSAYNHLAVGQSATETIEYTVDDTHGGTDVAKLVITINGTNDGPIPVDPAQPPIDPNNPPAGVPFDPQTPYLPPVDPTDYIPHQVGEDASPVAALDLTPYFGDPDAPDAVTLAIDPADLPAGLVFDPLTGTITGTPDNSASQATNVPGGTPGTYVIPVTATDPHGATFTTNVTFTITNPEPVAEDDALTGDEDTVVTTSLFDANGTPTGDTDPDGDVITVTRVAPGNDVADLTGLADGTGVAIGVDGSNGGTFIVNGDGTVTFNPGDDFNDLGVGESRTTEIVYQIDDGEGGTDTAVVTYVVTGTNDGPIPVDPAQPPIDPNNPPTGVPFDPQTPYLPPVDPTDYIPHQSGEDASPVAALDLTPYFGDPDAPDAVTLAIDPADLPPGLVFDPLTGTITGTPDNSASQATNVPGGPPGTYVIPVTATDPHGATFTTNVTFTITNPEPVAEDDGVLEAKDDRDLIIQPLGNDNDPDGDPLQIVEIDGISISPGGPAIKVEGGIVQLNVDGETLIFTPHFGYDGPAKFEYTVADADGATDIAEVALKIEAVDGFEQYLPRISANDSGHAIDGPDFAPESGMILDTYGLLSNSGYGNGEFGISGIVLDAVNGIDTLGGSTSSIGNAPAITSVLDAERLRGLADQAQQRFGSNYTQWGAEGLTGFSLRRDVDLTGSDASSWSSQLLIETLIRDRVLYVDLSDTLPESGNNKVIGYKIRQADGRPLPEWVQHAQDGSLLAKVPADARPLSLHIVALLADGGQIEHQVVIQTDNGEVKPLLQPRNDNAPSFEQQLRNSERGMFRR